MFSNADCLRVIKKSLRSGWIFVRVIPCRRAFGVDSRSLTYLLFLALLNNKERALQRIDKNLAELLPKDLKENIVWTPENSILDEVRAFYFKGQPVGEDTIMEYMDVSQVLPQIDSPY